MKNSKEKNSAIDEENALEFIDSLLSPEEIAESNLRVALMCDLIEARKKMGLSQN